MSIRNHINKLRLRGIEPDIIICDYADIMKSSRHYDQKRFEEESIYEELRALSQELGKPIWTASQINRSGTDVDVITLKYISECFSKAMISDLFLTINRKKDSSTPDLGNLFVAKNRMGPDGAILPLIINTALSRIELMPSEAYHTHSNENDEETSRNLKQKYKDFQNR